MHIKYKYSKYIYIFQKSFIFALRNIKKTEFTFIITKKSFTL